MTSVYKYWRENLKLVKQNPHVLNTEALKNVNKYIEELVNTFTVFDLHSVSELVQETGRILVNKTDALSQSLLDRGLVKSIEGENRIELLEEHKGEEYFVSHGGLLIMPFEKVWLETTLVGHKIAVTIEEITNEFDEKFLDFYFLSKGNAIKNCGVFAELKDEGFRVAIKDAKNPDHSKFAVTLAQIGIACLLIINAPYGIKTKTQPAHKAHARQAKREGYKLLPHHIITLDKSAPPKEYESVGTGGTPKAFHFVRSFIRHYKNGLKTIVKAHWRGDPRLGIHSASYKVK